MQEQPGPTLAFFQALETKRTRALVLRDMAICEALHAPEYQLITPAGRVMDRAAYLGAVSAGPFYEAWDIVGEMECRLTPHMAAIRYRARLRFPSGRVVEVWHTDTYECLQQGWQVVWSQATAISPA